MSVMKHHETLKRLFPGRHDAANNLFVQMHDHEFSELVIVASGKLKHMHEGGTEKIFSGDFFVIHPGSRHGYAELAPNTAVLNLLYHCNRMPPALALENFPLKNVFFPEKLCVTNADRLGRIPRRDLQTAILLITAIRKEENAPRPLTSPGDCIIAMRIAKARSLLEQPGSSLDSVARKTGFCCASHLSRTLRGRWMH